MNEDEEVVDQIDPKETGEEEVVIGDDNNELLSVEASKQGWVPLKKWVEQGNDPLEWRDPSSFIDRGLQWKRENHYKKQINDLKSSLRALGEHNQRLAEIGEEKTLAKLKADKVDALATGDGQKVVEIDDRIDEIKNARKVADDQPTEDPVLTKWLANPSNKWYFDDFDLKDKAEIIAWGWKAKHPESTTEEMLDYTEKEVKRTNPQKFLSESP